MNQTDIAQHFAQSMALQDVLDIPLTDAPLDDQSLYWDEGNGVLAAAERTLVVQAARGLLSDLEVLLQSQDTFTRELLNDERQLGLFLALFITANEMAERVQMVNGSRVLGGRVAGLSDVRVEIGARRGDFRMEFLLTWEEYGPHPDWQGAGDQVNPSGLTVTQELALVRRDDGTGGVDRKTRRLGLESLGLTVRAYEDEDAGRDPFGIAKRALQDVQTIADEGFVP